MGQLNRGERLQIMLSQTELRIIDTWRFKKRMPSRASAIRELLKRGLVAEGFLEAVEGQKSTSRFCRIDHFDVKGLIPSRTLISAWCRPGDFT